MTTPFFVYNNGANDQEIIGPYIELLKSCIHLALKKGLVMALFYLLY
jgi:hypothetical protein